MEDNKVVKTIQVVGIEEQNSNSKDKTSVDNKDVFYSISTIIRFLSCLGLSRVTKDSHGAVTVRDIRIKSTLFCSSWLVFQLTMTTLRFSWTYWNNPWDPLAYSELTRTIILAVQLHLIMIAAATESVASVREYFMNLSKVDEILNLRTTEHYEAERRSVNRHFFSLFVGCFVIDFCEMTLWMVAYGFKRCWPFTNDHVANLVQLVAQFYYFVRLSLQSRRLDIMIQQLGDDLTRREEIKYAPSQDRFTDVLTKYKACYVLLFKQHKIINQAHGFRVLLSISCILVSVIRTIYVTLIYTYEKVDGCLFAACAARTIPEILLLTSLVVYVSHIVDLRERALDILDHLVCTQLLSECERASVLDFIDQLHRQPLRFTAHNFFVLDYSLLCGLLNSTATYIIIFTQIKAPAGGEVPAMLVTR